jgi:pyruvate/2-oxoglutarate dehydrogenase complex dihydrolipoamide acyltransferase (E2) component
LKSSPIARKLAKQLNVQLDTLTGSGPGGRIVKRDVMAASENKTHQSAQYSTPTKQVSGDDILATLPISGLSKTIASRMVQSLQNTAQVSCHWESDITRLLTQRAELVEQEELLGTRVSVNAFLIKALVYAIRQVPIANANVVNDEIIIHRNINMGMAISIPGSTEYDSGLMVRVLRNVASMGLVAIDKGMRSLIARVRNGEATPDDLSGSTFTLSSTAGIGPPGLKTTPVLNQPNVALLGPSTPIEHPMIRDGEVKACTMLPLSFTFDHRALDGGPAARFMAALNNALEKTSLLLT